MFTHFTHVDALKNSQGSQRGALWHFGKASDFDQKFLDLISTLGAVLCL